MKNFLIIIIHCSFLIGYCYAQPTQEWVARFNEPSDTGIGTTTPQMGLDKLGNCYLFGNIPANGGVAKLVTIKYNAQGDSVWTRVYDPGIMNLAWNEAMAVDSIGNCYVTGYTGTSFGPYDIITIKYLPTGVEAWRKFYNGPGNASDDPRDMKIDAQNNIYITGISGQTAAIIKYKPNGDTIWVRNFNTSGYRSTGLSLGFDALNNVYIGGLTHNISQNRNYYMVVKYDSAGNFRWEGTWSGDPFDSPHKLSVDRNGNSYLTGEGSDGIVNGCLTVKWDSSGALQWKKAYSLNGLGEFGYSNAVDLSGNVYVTGATAITNVDYDYLLIKYSLSGDTLWIRKYAGSANSYDYSFNIILDDSSNSYITGSSKGAGTGRDIATLKYNTNGILQWVTRYNNNPPGNADDGGAVIAFDNNLRNVYVSGTSDRGGLIVDYVTIKYSQLTGITNINGQVPVQSKLFQNFPNPFNPETKLRFELSKSGFAEIRVFDIQGKQLNSIVNKKLSKGIYETTFKGSDYSSGIYFYSLIIDNNLVETKKMMLIK